MAIAVGSRSGKPAHLAKTRPYQQLQRRAVNASGSGARLVAGTLGNPVRKTIQGLGNGGQFDEGRTHMHVNTPA